VLMCGLGPRACRDMVSEAASEYNSHWATIESIMAKIGCTPEGW
jgi:hypothetical protein